jgi:hypothetical protein
MTSKIVLVAATVLSLCAIWEIAIRISNAWPTALPYILGGASLIVIIVEVARMIVRKR